MRIVTTLLLAIGMQILADEPKCEFTGHLSGQCMSVLEQSTLASYAKNIVKTGDVLELHHQNGTTTRFTGNSDGESYESYRSYRALAVLKTAQLAVILVGRWEGRQVLLVSLNDGTTYDVDGMPLVSPDQERVHSMDIDANYDANFIAIYRVVDARLEKEFALSGDDQDSEQWGPEDVKWLSSTKIEFSRVMHSSDPSGYSRVPWELTRNEKTWSAQARTEK